MGPIIGTSAAPTTPSARLPTGRPPLPLIGAPLTDDDWVVSLQEVRALQPYTSHRGDVVASFLLVAGILAAATCVTWMTTAEAGPVLWAFRIGSPLAIVACAWGARELTRARPETLPDLL